MERKYLLFNNQLYGINFSLLLIRLTSGGFMLSHGWGKMMKIIDGNFDFGDPIGLGVEASLILTVFAEIICAFLVLFGCFTRLATIPLIITMLVAVFVVHLDHDFGKKELGLFYMASYIILLISGGGKYSIDSIILKK